MSLFSLCCYSYTNSVYEPMIIDISNASLLDRLIENIDVSNVGLLDRLVENIDVSNGLVEPAIFERDIELNIGHFRPIIESLVQEPLHKSLDEALPNIGELEKMEEMEEMEEIIVSVTLEDEEISQINTLK